MVLPRTKGAGVMYQARQAAADTQMVWLATGPRRPFLTATFGVTSMLMVAVQTPYTMLPNKTPGGGVPCPVVMVEEVVVSRGIILSGPSPTVDFMAIVSTATAAQAVWDKRVVMLRQTIMVATAVVVRRAAMVAMRPPLWVDITPEASLVRDVSTQPTGIPAHLSILIAMAVQEAMVAMVVRDMVAPPIRPVAQVVMVRRAAMEASPHLSRLCITREIS